MIVEEDWEFGVKLADGLAARGYHPVLFRFVDAAIAEHNSIHLGRFLSDSGLPSPHPRATDRKR